MDAHRLLRAGLVVCAGLAVTPAAADSIHRNTFAGRYTTWVKGDDNVAAEEKLHELDDTTGKLPPPSTEHIRVSCAAGKAVNNYADYYYPLPAAPITDELSGGFYVKSSKSGVVFSVRVVLPKVANLDAADEPFTTVVPVETLRKANVWHEFRLDKLDKMLKIHQQQLRTKLRRDIDLTDAYVDRLVLNLYAGSGETDLYIDDLEVGPVRAAPPPPPDLKVPKKEAGPSGVSTGYAPGLPPRTERGLRVELDRGRLLVGGKPIFFRAVRHSGTPLHVLRKAGFNALWFDVDSSDAVVQDAIDNYRFWIIPHLPPLGPAGPDSSPGALAGTTASLSSRESAGLTTALQKFRASDAVLFWDFGPCRSEDVGRISKVADIVKQVDGNRPRGADVWDGFGKHSPNLELLASHRDPLQTSLELTRYRDWLEQRRVLADPGKFFWTWVQTHMPDWQMRLLYGRGAEDGDFQEPAGPQPEQIRLLTYLALATGCRGVGYWSDRFLADSKLGRDRLLVLAQLNEEIEMLEPLLLNRQGQVEWVESSQPEVKVAILRGPQGVLALPVWLGDGAQYVPSPGAVSNLSFKVPFAPEGSTPWEVSPARVQSLQFGSKTEVGGVRVVLPEFDLTAAVVFTTDLKGLVANWQRYSRTRSKFAAQWAIDLAEEERNKAVKVHEQLVNVAPAVGRADGWLADADKALADARREYLAGNDDNAYLAAQRALRPIRSLMRAHWERAVTTLDFPTASPYAVSYYTLPRHWKLAQLVRTSRVGPNALPDGDFERGPDGRPAGPFAKPLPPSPLVPGAPPIKPPPPNPLPAGWTTQEFVIDPVEVLVGVTDGAVAADVKPVKIEKKPKRYDPTVPVADPEPPRPDLGRGVLTISMAPKGVAPAKGGKPPAEPTALERAFVGVTSPPVALPAGSWVRISGWVRVVGPVRASADGALLYDSGAGESFALRLRDAQGWRHYHWYRQVPSTGEIRVRMALTGFGTVQFDDLKVEPLAEAGSKR